MGAWPHICDAQTLRMTDGSTPNGAATGAPVGSDSLSGIEDVNLYNGNLSFHVPLHTVGGRGTAQMAMMMAIDNQWNVKVEGISYPGQRYPTWVFGPELNAWSTKRPGYGPGLVVGRSSGEVADFSNCGDQYNPYSDYIEALTRFTVIMSDGTEYELRDASPNVNGKPLALGGYPCHRQGMNRGKIFVSADGSAATFISDQDIYDKADTRGLADFYPAGYLLLRDGSRFRIEGGLMKSLRDRNGNQILFNYDGDGRIQQIIDSLDRHIDIAYDVLAPSPYGLCDQITFKGFSASDRVVRVSKGPMHEALRSDQTIKNEHQLFPASNGSSVVDPIVTTSLWLANGQRYRFYYNSFAELARVELPTGGVVEYEHGGGYEGGSFYKTYPDDGNSFIYRRVTERRLSSDGVSWEGITRYLIDTTEGSSLDGLSVITVNHFDAAETLP